MTRSADPIEAAWARLLTQWEVPKEHDAFLERCRREGKLTVAASLYRARLAQAAAPELEAERRLAAIAFLATQELLASRSTAAPRTTPLWAWAVAAALVTAALYAIARAAGL